MRGQEERRVLIQAGMEWLPQEKGLLMVSQIHHQHARLETTRTEKELPHGQDPEQKGVVNFETDKTKQHLWGEQRGWKEEKWAAIEEVRTKGVAQEAMMEVAMESEARMKKVAQEATMERVMEEEALTKGAAQGVTEGEALTKGVAQEVKKEADARNHRIPTITLRLRERGQPRRSREREAEWVAAKHQNVAQ